MNKIKAHYTIPNFNTTGSCKVVCDLEKGLDKAIADMQSLYDHVLNDTLCE